MTTLGTSSSRPVRLPDPDTLARRLGAVRTVIAAAILTAPVPAARLLGADLATARRVTWLTRMLGVRDGALGVGTVAASRRGSGAAGWLVGGGVSDAVDAAVVLGALRSGRMRGLLPAAILLGAAGSAVVHGVAARSVR